MDKSIPFGTKVKIEGFGDTIFRVEDRGSAIINNRVDLYMDDLDAAVKFGRQNRVITIIE
ncbi:3D domain protein [compost metagenome]